MNAKDHWACLTPGFYHDNPVYSRTVKSGWAGIGPEKLDADDMTGKDESGIVKSAFSGELLLIEIVMPS